MYLISSSTMVQNLRNYMMNDDMCLFLNRSATAAVTAAPVMYCVPYAH